MIEGLEAMADDYLVKPFSARELLARVGAQLQLARLRREAAEREQALRQEAEALLNAAPLGIYVVGCRLQDPRCESHGQLCVPHDSRSHREGISMR